MPEAIPISEAVSEKKLTDWKKEPTLAELKRDYNEAKPGHDTCMQRVDEWLDNMHIRGKAKPKVVKNASNVQPKLIRKQAEWRYAALSEPFLSRPDIFKINPVTWEDVKPAQQNQLVLNNQFNTKLNKVAFIDEFVRCATDEGTVIVKVGWEVQEETFKEIVPDVRFFEDPTFAGTIQEIQDLYDANPQEFYKLPEPLQEAYKLSIEQGVPINPEIIGEKEVESTRLLKNQPTLEICDLHNVVLDPTAGGDVSKAGFAIFSFETSLSELKKDGRYTNLDSIDLTVRNILSEPDHQSSIDDDSENFTFQDDARKRFVVYEYWGSRDINDTGLAEPFVSAWVGDTKIRMEENPFPDKMIPFVAVQYLPVRRQAYGEPDGALLEDNQKILGAVTRGVIDLMGKSANSQQGVAKNALDPVNRRKFEDGRDYEFNPNIDPTTAMYMHKYPEIPASAEFMMQLQNAEAESMTGVKAFAGGLSGESLGDVATSVRGVLDAASKRELGILRRLSDGLLTIARKIIAMNQEFLSEKETVRITNEQFITVDREDLGGNFDLKLAISTAEEDNAQAQELAFMLQTVGPDEDPAMRRIILSEIARLRKMPELAETIENYQPQPDPVQQELQALELEKLRKEIELIESDIAKNYADAQLDNAKAADVSSATDQKDLDFVEQQTGVAQQKALQQTAEQARSQAELKVVDKALEVSADGLITSEDLKKRVAELEKFQNR